MELESHFFENHSPSVLTTVDFVAKRVASSCTKMIQNKGMLAVKNLFVDIVCEKFQGHITNEEPVTNYCLFLVLIFVLFNIYFVFCRMHNLKLMKTMLLNVVRF